MVSKAEGEALAAEYGMPMMETSAVANINVDEAFLALAKIAKDRILLDAASDHQKDAFTVHEQKKAAAPASGCAC